MNEEKISVIVPVYKVEPYLRQCVESIRAQTYQNLEILLVEDGSPDRCGVICEEYAAKDPRIVVIHQPNGGLSSARNTGIGQAKGAYLAFVDSDDRIAPTMLETLYRRARETGAELTLCNIRYVDECGQRILSGDPAREYRLPEAVWTQDEFWEQKRKKASPVYVVAWNKLYRRELFRAVRYPVGKLCEDEFVLHQIIDQCSRIATVPELLYDYCQRTGSIMTNKVNPRMLDKQEALLARAEYFYQKKHDSLVQTTVLEMIDLMEWFAYETKRAGNPLPELYAQRKQELLAFTRRPVCSLSPVYWGVVLSYRWGIFPYRFLRELYWWWVERRKKAAEKRENGV